MSSEPKILSLADIQAIEDLDTKTVDIPEWGGSIIIKALSRKFVRQAYSDCTDKKGNVDTDRLEKRLICWSCVDPKVAPDDYEWMVQKSSSAIQRIVSAIMAHSGLNQEALEESAESFRKEPD